MAEAQRECLTPLEYERVGVRAGHSVAAVAHADCYAPGGRHPLPSSVLMTAVTARVAGVEEVVVASPRPAPITRAAAAVAGADALLAAGGAQAVAALAFGVASAPADVVCGPGNRWVTAAKKHLAGEVGIDCLAGPSEQLLVIADRSADPELVAADLLAQAEHDPDAWPLVVATDAAPLARIEEALARRLETLPTAPVGRAARFTGGLSVLTFLRVRTWLASAPGCASTRRRWRASRGSRPTRGRRRSARGAALITPPAAPRSRTR